MPESEELRSRVTAKVDALIDQGLLGDLARFFVGRQLPRLGELIAGGIRAELETAGVPEAQIDLIAREAERIVVAQLAPRRPRGEAEAAPARQPAPRAAELAGAAPHETIH